MSVPKRTVRLVAEQFADIAALTGERGEIMYDTTHATLRLNDGETQGGIPLATQAWVVANVASGGVTIIDGGSATG